MIVRSRLLSFLEGFNGLGYYLRLSFESLEKLKSSRDISSPPSTDDAAVLRIHRNEDEGKISKQES